MGLSCVADMETTGSPQVLDRQNRVKSPAMGFRVEVVILAFAPRGTPPRPFGSALASGDPEERMAGWNRS